METQSLGSVVDVGSMGLRRDVERQPAGTTVFLCHREPRGRVVIYSYTRIEGKEGRGRLNMSFSDPRVPGGRLLLEAESMACSVITRRGRASRTRML